jgi:hypothetical protein
MNSNKDNRKPTMSFWNRQILRIEYVKKDYVKHNLGTEWFAIGIPVIALGKINVHITFPLVFFRALNAVYYSFIVLIYRNYKILYLNTMDSGINWITRKLQSNIYF